jgi:exodeoxyribonuclease-3
MKLKVLSYNTLYGGRDGDSDRRARAQAEFIADIKPDVFLMQEAHAFDAEGGALLYTLESRIGMRGFLAKAAATDGNVAVFIRDPLRPAAFQPDVTHFHHALAKLDVNLPGGQTLSLLCAHLCPYGPAIRRLEAAYLTAYASPKKMSLLAGDFNSVSPHGPEPEGFANLPPHHRARHLSADKPGVDRSVLVLLESAGWVDLGHALGGAEPTVPTAGSHDAEFPVTRLDYVMASQALASRAKAFQVLRTPVTDWASDHYPVLATFDFPESG